MAYASLPNRRGNCNERNYQSNERKKFLTAYLTIIRRKKRQVSESKSKVVQDIDYYEALFNFVGTL